MEDGKEIRTSTVVTPVDLPVGLSHLNSEFCWCDPTVFDEEEDEKVLIHHEVTWH